MKSVLGMENSKTGTRDNPEYHTTIPFTRMLAGPMDQTPGAFDNRTREEFTPRMESPIGDGHAGASVGHVRDLSVCIPNGFRRADAYDNQPLFNHQKIRRRHGTKLVC